MTNTALWLAQVLLVLVFGYSAAVKGTQSRERAVELGMTGVANVPVPVMRFIALCEGLGIVGLVLPHVARVALWLTPLAAVGLALIMVFAARIHWQLGERFTAAANLVLFGLCVFVAAGRWPG